jgi:hypothetical protein
MVVAHKGDARMNQNFKQLTRDLDLCGQTQREEVRKQEQGRQVAQQIDAAAAVRRGLQGHLAEMQRTINVKRMLNDPAELYFRLANSKPHLT